MYLSIRAQAIAAGYFGLNPNMKLTLRNVENRLTAENAKAMSELIGAGLIKAEKAPDSNPASVVYALTPKGRKTKLAKSLSWMEKHGAFSLTEPVT